ncbi:MAG: hypothetical protein Q9170_005145 [Blastenia crenularia]
MPSPSPSTGLTITNPLVLYRSLLATKRIGPDPAQHRLALHLEKLYHRLKDYEPDVDYKHQLNRLIHAAVQPPARDGGRQGIFSSFREQKQKIDALALTRRLTDHEAAIQLQSPQGLLLHGEVGTGKSMLVDLLADCLPSRKKRRWHFNTFMLETFTKLEQLRRKRRSAPASQDEEHSLLCLARDLISTSPILVLDEFQLPDRAASKILSNLFTSFFHLGGVLIATSNRMPEELANASGVEFAAPPVSRLGVFRDPWGFLGSSSRGRRSESMFSGKGDFTPFLEVLRARCEIWEMEGSKDWRRREIEEATYPGFEEKPTSSEEEGFHGLQPLVPGNWGLGYEQSIAMSRQEQVIMKESSNLPVYYFLDRTSPVADSAMDGDHRWLSAMRRALSTGPTGPSDITEIPWQSTFFRVYGRNLNVPRGFSGVSYWTFAELCASALGPADYITLASNFHTLVLVDVPILTALHKNEARRLITLLDALYEARCRLIFRGAAGPDDVFFPDDPYPPCAGERLSTDSDIASDGVYPETFSEIYQDQTSPFRPNVSAYTSTASPPSYDSSPLPSSPSRGSEAVRSILADEDSDFGPVYSGGRIPGSRYRSSIDGTAGAGNKVGQQSSLNFARASMFTGEDERFAYKRARSRLWEMCGALWWARGEPWWQPLGKELRRWESKGAVDDGEQGVAAAGSSDEAGDEGVLFRYGASPFRTSQEPPPKISWTHAWGMMKWGKKAGAWGQGPQGLVGRRRQSE